MHKTSAAFAANIPAISVWFASFIATSVMVTIGYLWLDRPIALFIDKYSHWHHHAVVAPLSDIPDPLIPIAAIVFVVAGFRVFIGHSFSKHEVATLLCSISIIVAAMIKGELKFLFGRTWPDTWIDNNASFIRDGVYGFNFMHGGTGYQSFPSGHMTVICAAVIVLWILYPQLRWVWAFVSLAVGALLVGANYHFLSDVIAGAFVGISTGWMTLAIWTRMSWRGEFQRVTIDSA